MYNGFMQIMTIIKRFRTLKSQGITDLVLDLGIMEVDQYLPLPSSQYDYRTIYRKSFCKTAMESKNQQLL
jgi:hypothetical protein